MYSFTKNSRACETGIYLSPDSATTTIHRPNTTRRNPEIGVMLECAPVIRWGTYGVRVALSMFKKP